MLKKPSLRFLNPFCFSLLLWSLDFKSQGAGAGAVFQLPIVLVYVCVCFWIWHKNAVKTRLPFSLKILFAAAVFFAVCSSLTGLWRGQQVWSIATNTIPIMAFASAAVTVFYVLNSMGDPRPFKKRLIQICLIFTIVHFGLTVAGGGLNLSTSRYEVLSGAVVPASAVFATCFFLPVGWDAILLSLANVIVILISVTRTELAIMLGQACLLFLAWPKIMLRFSSVKKIFGVFVLLFFVVFVDFAADTGLTQRWVERVTVTRKMGADPTALSRIAETNFMVREFTGELQHFLFGNGLAAPTSLIGPEMALASSLVGVDSFTFHSIGFGHNNYASLLFIGGIVIGGPILLMLLLGGLQSFALIRRLLINRQNLPYAVTYIGIWGGLIICGTLIESALAGTFGDRPASLWYGIGTGMMYWARQKALTAPSKPLAQKAAG